MLALMLIKSEGNLSFQLKAGGLSVLEFHSALIVNRDYNFALGTLIPNSVRIPPTPPIGIIKDLENKDHRT